MSMLFTHGGAAAAAATREVLARASGCSHGGGAQPGRVFFSLAHSRLIFESPTTRVGSCKVAVVCIANCCCWNLSRVEIVLFCVCAGGVTKPSCPSRFYYF